MKLFFLVYSFFISIKKITSSDTITTTSSTTTTASSTSSSSSGFIDYNYYQTTWPQSCFGNNQSPINIDTKHLNNTSVFKFITVNYNILNRILLSTQDKKVLYLDATTLGYVNVSIYGHNYRFDTQSVIFHFPSEHIIDNRQADIEIQIVHTLNKDDHSNPKNTKLIISTLFQRQQGIADNKIIKSFKIDRRGPVAKLDLSSFPPVNKEFYFYEGSDTIPNCDENVNWIITKNMEPISKAQMLSFVEWITDVYSLTGNNRNIQNTGKRYVYYQYTPLAQTASGNYIKIAISNVNILFLICILICLM